MPKVYKATQIYKMLISLWFEKISQKWSHMKLKNEKWVIVILPIHNKDIPYWTFLSILSQWNISIDQAKDILGK